MGLVAVPLMTLAALLGGVLPANAATGPDGFPYLYADNGDIVHQCQVLQTGADGDKAVMCVDIDTYGDSSGYYATGAIEALCENSASVVVQCRAIYLHGFLANADSGPTYSSNSLCTDGCRAQRFTIYTATYSYTSGHCTSSGHDVWDAAMGDSYIGTSDSPTVITLADSGKANDGSDFSTGHYWICP
jgi:hypothetical protein